MEPANISCLYPGSPGVSATVFQRRTVSICREGLYYFFVLAFIVGGATLREKNLLFILAGMMIGPLLFNWRLVVLSLRRLEVFRRLPQHAFAGQSFRVEVGGINHRRRLGSWAVVVEDAICHEGTQQIAAGDKRQSTKAAVMLPYVAAGGSKRTGYRVTLPRRGYYRFGPLNVFTRFPLGLMKAVTRVKSYQRLLVYPRLGQLKPGWLRQLDAERYGAQQMHRRQGPIDGDYYGLREWRSGDSRRWIHWRTSAKLGKLAVRQFEQQQNRDLILVLDLWQSPKPPNAERNRVELAISFAASLIDDLCRRGGSRIAVAVAGAPIPDKQHPQHWAGTASAAFEHSSMECLALSAGHAHNELGPALKAAIGEAQPCDQVVVVSTRPFEHIDDSAKEALAASPRHHRALRRAIWVNVSDDDKMKEIFEFK